MQQQSHRSTMELAPPVAHTSQAQTKEPILQWNSCDGRSMPQSSAPSSDMIDPGSQGGLGNAWSNRW